MNTKTIEDYITHLWQQDGSPMTRNIDLARLKERLKTGKQTKKELEKFIEWRNELEGY